MTLVSMLVEGLVSVAARRWRVPAGDDRVREWQGELHALRHEPGVPPAVRAHRQVAFALSLATSRPARSQDPAAAALDTVWALVGALRPVLALLAVPGIAIGLIQGYSNAARQSVLTMLLAHATGGPVGAFDGLTAAFWVALVLLTGGVLLGAGMFSRAWSAADPAPRRRARLVAAPVLLAAGALLTPRPPIPVVGLAAAAVVLAAAGLWADRIDGGRRLLVLAPAGVVAAAVLFATGQGLATMAQGDVRTPAVTLAVALFAVRCAAATTRRVAVRAPAVDAAPAARSTGEITPAHRPRVRHLVRR